MIVDKIENAHLYKTLNSGIAKALTFIETADVSSLTLGRHEIDGDNIFAIVSEYFTTEKNNGLLEAHNQYIDLQYLIEGFENIGVATYTNQKPIKAYNIKDDCFLYNEAYQQIYIKKGMFVIFFRDDIHLPGLVAKEAARVKKIIIKIKM